MSPSYKIHPDIKAEFEKASVEVALLRKLRRLFVGSSLEELSRIRITIEDGTARE